jgi:hypothetical protein
LAAAVRFVLDFLVLVRRSAIAHPSLDPWFAAPDYLSSEGRTRR